MFYYYKYDVLQLGILIEKFKIVQGFFLYV